MHGAEITVIALEYLPDLFREEKSDLEMEYEARLREMDEKHQHELQELENAYQQTIMGEVERYQVIYTPEKT